MATMHQSHSAVLTVRYHLPLFLPIQKSGWSGDFVDRQRHSDHLPDLQLPYVSASIRQLDVPLLLVRALTIENVKLIRLTWCNPSFRWPFALNKPGRLALSTVI